MGRRIPLIAIVALAGAAPPAAQAADSPKDFTAVSRVVESDSGPKSNTFEEKLYVNGRLVGRDRVLCKFGKPTTCLARFSLDGGTIVGKGPLRRKADRLTLPIVGGSDRYDEAKGILLIEDLPKKKSRLTFNFR